MLLQPQKVCAMRPVTELFKAFLEEAQRLGIEVSTSRVIDQADIFKYDALAQAGNVLSSSQVVFLTTPAMSCTDIHTIFRHAQCVLPKLID